MGDNHVKVDVEVAYDYRRAEVLVLRKPTLIFNRRAGSLNVKPLPRQCPGKAAVYSFYGVGQKFLYRPLPVMVVRGKDLWIDELVKITFHNERAAKDFRALLSSVVQEEEEKEADKMAEPMVAVTAEDTERLGLHQVHMPEGYGLPLPPEEGGADTLPAAKRAKMLKDTVKQREIDARPARAMVPAWVLALPQWDSAPPPEEQEGPSILEENAAKKPRKGERVVVEGAMEEEREEDDDDVEGLGLPCGLDDADEAEERRPSPEEGREAKRQRREVAAEGEGEALEAEECCEPEEAETKDVLAAAQCGRPLSDDVAAPPAVRTPLVVDLTDTPSGVVVAVPDSDEDDEELATAVLPSVRRELRRFGDGGFDWLKAAAGHEPEEYWALVAEWSRRNDDSVLEEVYDWRWAELVAPPPVHEREPGKANPPADGEAVQEASSSGSSSSGVGRPPPVNDAVEVSGSPGSAAPSSGSASVGLAAGATAGDLMDVRARDSVEEEETARRRRAEEAKEEGKAESPPKRARTEREVATAALPLWMRYQYGAGWGSRFHRSHRLMVAVPIVYCADCGRWSYDGNVFALGKMCRGRLDESVHDHGYKKRMRLLDRGIHPTMGHALEMAPLPLHRPR